MTGLAVLQAGVVEVMGGDVVDVASGTEDCAGTGTTTTKGKEQSVVWPKVQSLEFESIGKSQRNLSPSQTRPRGKGIAFGHVHTIIDGNFLKTTRIIIGRVFKGKNQIDGTLLRYKTDVVNVRYPSRELTVGDLVSKRCYYCTSIGTVLEVGGKGQHV